MIIRALMQRLKFNLAVILLAPLGGAHAAEPAAPPADVSACVGVADPTERLACYDAASGRAKTAPAVVPTREPASAATSGAASSSSTSSTPSAPAGPPRVSSASPADARFGDNGQLRGEAQARRSAPSEIKAYVKRVASLPNGRYRLTLDNDQVWQTTEADWAVEFNAEDAVTISRLPLGGYQIALSGENRTLSVKRTQ
jgi:hypothetical protein